jgi:hypothetical protein
MNDDELRARLQAADPARSDAPADSWIDELVEATMTVQDRNEQERPVRRRRWLVSGAAAAAAVVAVGGYAFVAGGSGDDDKGRDEARTEMVLSLPDPGAMQSCVQFSVDILRDMQSAFDGTATEVDDAGVTLDVNRWYKGGDTDVVVLDNPSDLPVSLEGEIDFVEGERYLVTATDGAVNICGYSGVWTQEMADAFETAYGG